jgi:pseudouridine synthase
MRLQHFLAQAGVGSRRQCEKLITAGRIRVNGHVVQTLGAKIDPEHDEVHIDNKPVGTEEKFYMVLHKPSGYLSTVIDNRGRPTVSDLVRDVPARLYPVGRLDMDTEGILLMTNDGDFCYRMTHPKFEIKKTYLAEVKGKPSRRALAELRRGVKMEEGETSPAEVKLIKSAGNCSTVEITIHEGRKRQVKKMCKAVGYPVKRLKRIEFGGIRLGNLRPAHYRPLSDSERKRLFKDAGMDYS